MKYVCIAIHNNKSERISESHYKNIVIHKCLEYIYKIITEKCDENIDEYMVDLLNWKDLKESIWNELDDNEYYYDKKQYHFIIQYIG